MPGSSGPTAVPSYGPTAVPGGDDDAGACAVVPHSPDQENCDFYVDNLDFTCVYLESVYDADCSGCACDDAGNTNSADESSNSYSYSYDDDYDDDCESGWETLFCESGSLMYAGGCGDDTCGSCPYTYNYTYLSSGAYTCDGTYFYAGDGPLPLPGCYWNECEGAFGGAPRPSARLSASRVPGLPCVRQRSA